ncbi:MAG: N-acetylmuramoyl-L-alanine amidase [Hyphomicrobium sp. 32-62-53]|nr:MAG: N-acetylmuramoyl-L-alanine amidase [Hyphomicrobium sp. 32-62-53]
MRATLLALALLWPLALALTHIAQATAIDPNPPLQLAQTVVEKSNPAAVQAPPSPLLSQATAVDVLGDRQSTLIQLTLSKGVTTEIYTLANPYRVIVDLPGVVFKLPSDAGREGKARMVLDTAGPVAIAKAAMTKARSGPGVVLTIELNPTNTAAFGEGTGSGRTPPAPVETASEPRAAAGPKTPQSKPVIVIDPGHGGIDPGAVGANNMLEKNLVLAVAKRVEAQLSETGNYEIVMTRARDVFISLNDRLKISRKAGADLFISIHADSIEQTYAQSIKGATVYTLSERASDAEARAIAEKENASDLIAGLDVAKGEENDDVKNILIDLMKRETANFSAEFSRTLVRSLKSKISLSRDPERAAAFKVLRQTHAPSVLVELGYVSNPEESRQMQSADWQDKVAKSIANAINAYFSKRTPAPR